jgi:hypothetical protein
MDPIAAKQTWELANGHRFRIVADHGRGIWLCKSISDPSRPEEEHTEKAILSFSVPTEIQFGQIWVDTNGSIRETLGCQRTHQWIWDTKTGPACEDVILRNWTRVDPSAVNGYWPKPDNTPKPILKPEPKCPLCGSIGNQGFNMFECSSPSCRNYRRPS